MGYFDDLTPYSYIVSRFTVQPDALNIGWLDGKQPFERGPVPSGFSERLSELVKHPVNLCHGWHTCWCGAASGNGEIRVSSGAAVYAAPVLIAHYIEAHGYRPPQPFIDAVMAGAALPAAAEGQ